MAFTGTPAISTIVTGRVVLIEGLSLGAADVGQIDLAGTASGGIKLPASFDPKPYATPDGAVSNLRALSVSYESVDAHVAALELRIQYGTSPLIQVMNDDGVNATGDLRIYVKYKGG